MPNSNIDRCEKYFLKYLNSFVKKIHDKKILDIGCGNGDHTVVFCKNKNKVTGLDVVDLRFEEYKKNFKFVKSSGRILPFKNNSFDIVISLDVIEHVKNDDFFVEEIYRVLKKDGRILIATPNKNRLSNILLKLMGKPIKYPYLIGKSKNLGNMIHIREYLESELYDLFQKHNFKKIKIKKFWFGLRGFLNIGVEQPLFNQFHSIHLLTAKK